MSIVWMEGFDKHGNDVFPLNGPDVIRYNDINGSAGSGGDVNFEGNTGRFGTGGCTLKLGGAGGDVFIDMPTHIGSLSESYVSMWYRSQDATAVNGNVVAFYAGQFPGTRQLLLEITGSNFSFYDNAVVAGGSLTPVVGTWYHLELYTALSTGSTGSVILRVDGVEDIRSTGINVQNNGDGNEWDTLRFEHPDSAARNSRIDDLVIQDGDGAWLGKHRIFTHTVDADVAVAWTRSSGSTNFGLLNDSTGPDHDASYVSAATTGLRDEYGIDDVSAVGPVLAISVKAMNDKTDVQFVGIDLGVKSSTSEELGFRQVWGKSTVGYTESQVVIETDPNTASLPWTNATVKAASVIVDRVD